MDVVLRAHTSNATPSGHTQDMEQPLFMPLDPKDNDTTTEETGADGSELGDEIVVAVPAVGPARQDESAPADASSVWLQAYTDHLSGDMDADDVDMEHDTSDQSQLVSAVPSLLPQSNLSIMTPTMSTLVSEAEHMHAQGQGQGFMNMNMNMNMDMALDVADDFPVHMAGAILTSMSGGGTPGFGLPAQDQVDAQMNDVFAELFGQLPAFEMPMPANMFLGLGTGGDGNMWADVFTPRC